MEELRGSQEGWPVASSLLPHHPQTGSDNPKVMASREGLGRLGRVPGLWNLSLDLDCVVWDPAGRGSDVLSSLVLTTLPTLLLSYDASEGLALRAGGYQVGLRVAET